MVADTPGERKRMLVGRIVDSRRTGESVIFGTATASVEYDDRTIRLERIDEGDNRDRLESLLSEYHVLKIEQPETRKADDGIVYLSAVTDAKLAADFIESLFRTVYGGDEDYELRTTETS
jgi:hypothetical protein